MKRLLRKLFLLGLLAAGAVVAYGASGFLAARSEALALRDRADALIAAEQGGAALGPGRQAQLLEVQDPGFLRHGGVDLISPGAGATTITQALAQRLDAGPLPPEIDRIRQTGFAFGLETRLEKAQILALWLDEAEMGRGPEGMMTGFFDTARTVYGKPPQELTEEQYLSLVAVLIAPGRYSLQAPGPALEERRDRIALLVSGKCRPAGHDDVWLEGCDQS
ncbi:transglycosylase domain-containing protein [Pseudooceanicola sp. 502str34]